MFKFNLSHVNKKTVGMVILGVLAIHGLIGWTLLQFRPAKPKLSVAAKPINIELVAADSVVQADKPKLESKRDPISEPEPIAKPSIAVEPKSAARSSLQSQSQPPFKTQPKSKLKPAVNSKPERDSALPIKPKTAVSTHLAQQQQNTNPQHPTRAQTTQERLGQEPTKQTQRHQEKLNQDKLNQAKLKPVLEQQAATKHTKQDQRHAQTATKRQDEEHAKRETNKINQKVENQAAQQATTNEPVSFSIEQADWLNKPTPELPERLAGLMRPGSHHTVVLELRVNKQGGIDDVTVVTSSGNNLIDQTAVRQIKQGTFYPFKQNGVAVVGMVTLSVDYAK